MPKPIKESSQAGSESETTVRNPTREEIEQRAYELYVESGRAQGNDVENWLQAELELREKYGKKAGTAKATAV